MRRSMGVLMLWVLFLPVLAALGAPYLKTEPGRDSFWRLASSNCYWERYGHAGGSKGTVTNYFYDPEHARHLDSLTVNTHYSSDSIGREYATYSYQLFPGYYEVTENWFNRTYPPQALTRVTVSRYTYQDLILSVRIYNSQNILGEETTYSYDAAGNLTQRTRSTWLGQAWEIREQESWVYNSDNLLTGRTLSEWVHGNGLLEETETEQRFYSTRATPDSIHSWHLEGGYSFGYEYATRSLNHFDAQGNVELKEEWIVRTQVPGGSTATTFRQSFSGFTSSPRGYLPLWTRIYNSYDTSSSGDSTHIYYEYSADFRQADRDYICYLGSGSITESSTQHYNEAWIVTRELGNYADPIFNNFQSYDNSWTWEFVEETDPPGIPPELFGITGIAPNPFTTQAKINFVMVDSGSARISIYNLRGQKLNCFTRDNLDPGEHQVLWDGKDSRGNLAPPGIYLVRLSTIQGTDVEKMIRLK